LTVGQTRRRAVSRPIPGSEAEIRRDGCREAGGRWGMATLEAVAAFEALLWRLAWSRGITTAAVARVLLDAGVRNVDAWGRLTLAERRAVNVALWGVAQRRG